MEMAGERVGKGQAGGVEADAADHRIVGAVAPVAHDGASHLGQVDADLVFPARVGPDLEERVGGQLFHDAIMGHRQFGALGLVHRIDPPVDALLEPGLDRPLIRRRHAFHQRQISFFRVAPSRFERFLGFAVLGEKDQP